MKKIPAAFVLSLIFVSVLNSYGAGKPDDQRWFGSSFLENIHVTVATPAAPVVVTGGASEVQDTSVKFNGNVNPNNDATSAWFDWGTSPVYGNSTPPQGIGSGSTFVGVSQTVAGLLPNTVYHYRTVGMNGFGTVNGGDHTATTLAIPPAVTTVNVSGIGDEFATLHGSANPNNSSSTGYFEWGPDTTYGTTTASQSLGGGMSVVNYTTMITGLTSGTTYHFRAVAFNSAGTVHGADQLFATLASPNEYQPDSNTIALYHCNESEGTFVRDYSSNNLHGTASSENIGEGRYGNARHYNLSSDIIVVNNNPAFNAASTHLTVEAWVFPLLGGLGDLTIASRGHPDSANFSYALIARSSKRLEFVLNDSAGGRYSVLSADSPLTDGVWHHVAAVVKCESSSVTLYLNGIAIPAIPSGTFNHCIVPKGSFSIGLPYAGPAMRPVSAPRTPESGALFHCGVDEIRISRVARNPLEFNIKGVIRGTKFHDLNANGSRDNGEPGLNGWTIILAGTAAETTHTDANGEYSFSSLSPGSYTVSESSQTGWTQTLPPSNGSYSVALTIGLDTSGLDFGNFAPSIRVSKGWNIVSLPVTVTDSNVTTIFPSAISSAFSYGISGYSPVSKLQNRSGYWLKFANDEVVPAPGSPRLTDTLGGLDSWNLVGSVSNPVPVSAITTDPSGGIVPPLFGYSGSYVVVDSIKPGKGYWAKLTFPTRLVVDGSIASPASTANRRNELSPLNTISFTDADHNAQTLYFGIADQTFVDRYELPPLPPDGLFDVRFGANHLVEGYKTDDSSERTIHLQGMRFPVTLRWNITDPRIPYVLGTGGGPNIELSASGTVSVHTLSSTLVLRTGAEVLPMPKHFALRQNYPNPFNPSTMIRYELASPGRVTLNVYNMLGQQVAALLDEFQSAGFKETEFNAGALPSGVYTYVLSAGDFRDSKSMIVLK